MPHWLSHFCRMNAKTTENANERANEMATSELYLCALIVCDGLTGWFWHKRREICTLFQLSMCACTLFPCRFAQSIHTTQSHMYETTHETKTKWNASTKETVRKKGERMSEQTNGWTCVSWCECVRNKYETGWVTHRFFTVCAKCVFHYVLSHIRTKI